MNPPVRLEFFLAENRLSEYLSHLEKEGYEVQDLLESDEATLLELVGGKKAHLGRLKNGLEKLRGGGGAQGQGGTSRVLLELSGELPMVLAGPAFEFAGGHESSPVLRLWALCDLVELGARLAVVAGLAEHRGNPPEKLRGILCEKIERPTVCHWLHMARAVAENQPSGALFPALARFVAQLDKNLCGPGNIKSSAVTLRNRLAHGGLNKKAAAEILSAWEGRSEALAEVFSPWRDFNLVCMAADGQARLLRGTEPGPWNGQAPGKGSGMVRGIVGGKELDLWPLMVDSRDGEAAVSAIYSRRGEVRIEYTPFEGDLALLELDIDQGFLDLFRRPEKKTPSPFRHQDFSEELRKEASRRIGREEELGRLAQAAASLPPGGILWVGGVAGMGKSCLVASAASALLEEQKDQSLVLAYRFRAGGGRCSVEDFLAFACERIEAWEGLDKTLFQNAKEPNSTQARFLELLRCLKEGRDLLVVADGLDELPPQSDNWLDTVILASTKGRESGARIRWILAGRPERGIDTKLLAGGARKVFPGGLPPMRPGDVRSFFFERLSRSKVRSRLLERDEEKAGSASNPFLDEVVRRSEGLPVYMNHVAGDLIAGRITPDQERQLPKGLAAYHEELLRRCAVGDLQAVMTPLVAILALAHEPLGAPLLTTILRSAGRIDSENIPLVERALAGVSSMIRRTPLPGGTDGFTLYHTSLREHIRSTDSFRETLAAMRKKLSAFCSEAMREGRKNLPRYVRRQAVKHFLEAEDWDSSAAALSDIEFIEARAVAQELPAMLGDYAEAASRLPEGEKERQTEDARQAELDRYACEMYEYSATWARIREGSGEPEPPLPSPVESVRLWSEEEIAEECKRITESPNRLDTVKAFRVFVATNSTPLQEYSTQEGFVANLARNEAPAGPVHEEGKRRLEPLNCIKLFKQFAPFENWNPLPASKAILQGHKNGVYSVAISADLRKAVSGSWDNTIRIWDMQSCDCLKILQGHTNRVRSIAINCDCRIVVSGGEDKSVRLWDIETGRCLQVMHGHKGHVDAVDLTHDGKLIASGGSFDKTIRIWDGQSGECLKVLHGHEGHVHAVRLSRDQKILVSSSGASDEEGSNKDNTLRIWDARSGECLKILHGHEDSVNSLAISSDGGLIVSGSSDRTVRIWDAMSGECLRVLNDHDRVVTSVAISDDGRLVVSGSKDLRIWDALSGKCLMILNDHENIVNAVAISADGHCIASGSGWDRTLRIWDIGNGRHAKSLRTHKSNIRSVSISNNGKLAITGSADKSIGVWNCKTGECTKLLCGHESGVEAVVLSKDGRRAFSGGADKTVRIWDAEIGTCLHTLKGHESGIYSLTLNYEGQHIISGDNGQTIRIWDAVSGKCINIILCNSYRVLSLASSVSGSIVSGDSDKTLRIWNSQTGNCNKELTGHKGWIYSTTVSVDGLLVISGGGVQDKSVYIWDIQTGACLNILKGHEGPIFFVGISIDGRFIVSASPDATVRIWNKDTGECIGMFFQRGLSCAQFQSQAGRLVTGFTDGRVNFYKIENLLLEPYIATARREILSEDLPAGAVTARPPCCGQLISIPPTIADRIEHWALHGGEGGYTDPALLLDCPSCSTPLRMNPFFVDVKPSK